MSAYYFKKSLLMLYGGSWQHKKPREEYISYFPIGVIKPMAKTTSGRNGLSGAYAQEGSESITMLVRV